MRCGQLWLFVSAGLLTVAWFIEPYLFAYLTWAAAAVSAGLFVWALLRPPRDLPVIGYLLISSLPSLIAMFLLLSLSWA